MKVLGALIAMWAAVGCGGASSPAVTVSPAQLALEREVGGWYTRFSESLASGELDGVASMFAPDGLFIGEAPDEVAVGPAAIAGKARRPAGELASTALAIGVAASGRAAWVSDVHGAERPLRATVVVEKEGDGWRAVLAHTSRAVPGDLVRQREDEARFPPLADVGDEIPEDAQTLAQLLSTGLGGAEALTALISKHPGIVAFGPMPDDRFTGTHDVSEWVRSLYAREGARLVRNGGMRAGIAAGGDVGWVATNVDLAVTRGPRELSRPCRFTVVFAREGGSWAIVQMHLSHAVPDVK